MLATSLLVNEIAGALEYVPMVAADVGSVPAAADTLIDEAGELADRFQLDGAEASINVRIEDWHRRSVEAVGGCVVASGADAATTVLGVFVDVLVAASPVARRGASRARRRRRGGGDGPHVVAVTLAVLR